MKGSSRARRSPRLVLPVALLALVLLGASGLQFYLPRLAAGAIRSAVAQNLHTTASVEVHGLFWQLADGSFQNLSLRLGPSRYQGYRLQSASLSWQAGRIALQGLLAGQLKVLRPGRLTLRIVMNQDALREVVQEGLRQAMPQAAAGSLPEIAVTPKGISLRGQVTFLGLPVRYLVEGGLVLQDRGQVLAFQARDFNDSVLHLPPIPVLRMQDLPRIPGLPLHIAGVRLLPGGLAITLSGPS